MKILQKTLLALAAGSLMTAGAQAAITYGNGMTAQPYIGAKVGMYDVDESDVDNATSYGIYGGAMFTPNFGIEAEYMTTGDEDLGADASGLDIPAGVTVDVNSEYSADVYGLYGTYEYMVPNTPVYAKARLGFAKNEIEVETTATARNAVDTYTESGSETISDTGIAGGIGLGYNLTPNAVVELSYEWYPTIEDEGFEVDASGITLGANFKIKSAKYLDTNKSFL